MIVATIWRSAWRHVWYLFCTTLQYIVLLHALIHNFKCSIPVHCTTATKELWRIACWTISFYIIDSLVVLLWQSVTECVESVCAPRTNSQSFINVLHFKFLQHLCHIACAAWVKQFSYKFRGDGTPPEAPAHISFQQRFVSYAHTSAHLTVSWASSIMRPRVQCDIWLW